MDVNLVKPSLKPFLRLQYTINKKPCFLHLPFEVFKAVKMDGMKPNINREIHNSSEHRAANMANCLSVSAFRLFYTERWCIFVTSLEPLRAEDFSPLNRTATEGKT
ncbi:hypothetical protein BaRGS_00019875 [Batillaria attramentaria]|uniref:Uncharacterized protein n=1 Tax=Batillaria attramentaria TaxID=370345 RepID=A0ABD0KNU1_9CAEN